MIQMPEWLGVLLVGMAGGGMLAFIGATRAYWREQDLRIYWQQETERLRIEQEALLLTLRGAEKPV